MPEPIEIEGFPIPPEGWWWELRKEQWMHMTTYPKNHWWVTPPEPLQYTETTRSLVLTNGTDWHGKNDRDYHYEQLQFNTIGDLTAIAKEILSSWEKSQQQQALWGDIEPGESKKIVPKEHQNRITGMRIYDRTSKDMPSDPKQGTVED